MTTCNARFLLQGGGGIYGGSGVCNPSMEHCEVQLCLGIGFLMVTVELHSLPIWTAGREPIIICVTSTHCIIWQPLVLQQCVCLLG